MTAPLPEHLRAFRYRYGLLGPTRLRARQQERSMIFSPDEEARPSSRNLARHPASEARRDVVRVWSGTGLVDFAPGASMVE